MPVSNRTAFLSLRGISAALATFIGSLLLIVAPGRSADWFFEGLALAVVGVAILTFGFATIMSSSKRILAGMVISTTTVTLWLVVTRTSGYPFGPWSATTPHMGPYEILVLVSCIVSLSLNSALLLVGTEHLGKEGFRFDTFAPLAIVIVALPGLAVSRWVDDGSHIMGSGHVHTQSISSADMSSMPGMDHSKMISDEQRTQLGQQLVDARAAAMQYPTLVDARSAGWVLTGGYVNGVGQMLMRPATDSQNPTFDPMYPQGLLFASSIDSAPIVAVQYNAWTPDGSTPVGFVGQDMMWHMHAGTCELRNSELVVYDEAVTGKACSSIDAVLTNTVSWMVRAWVVPGWENSQGVFAHDNSLLP